MRVAPIFGTIVPVVLVAGGNSTSARAQSPVGAVVAVSPDGLEFARSTADNLIEIRSRTQPATAQPVVTLSGPKDRLTALTFNSDGTYIAAAADDRRVYVWRISDRKLVDQLVEPDDPIPDQKRVSHVGAIAFDPSGTQLGVVDDGFRWFMRFSGGSTEDLTQRVTKTTPAQYFSLAADGHGGWVAGDSIGSFHFYDADMNQLSATTSMVAGAIRSMSVSPDGLLLATGDDSNQVKVWFFGSAATASQAGHFGLKDRNQAKSAVVSVAFSIDSKTLQFADAASNVSTWTVPGSDTITTLATNPPAGASTTNPSTAITTPATTTPPTTSTSTVTPPATGGTAPSGGTAATTTPPTTVPPTAKPASPPAGTTSTPPSDLIKRDPGGVSRGSNSNVKPSPPPTKVATLPPPTKHLSASVTLAKSLVGHSEYVNSVAFSPDGLSIASASRDKTVRLWDVASGNQRIIGKHDAYVSCVAFSPDGGLLASGGWDNHIKLFQMPAGTPKDEGGKLDKHSSYVLSLAFSPDGKSLADGSNDKTAHVFSFVTGSSRSTPNLPDGIAAVAFSPDGAYVAGGCLDGSVYIWDAKTMSVLHRLPGNPTNPVFCVTFINPNALVAAGRGGVLHVWRIATAKLIATVPAGRQDLFALAYSPDDHIVASGGADRLIRLWSASDLDLPAKIIAPLTTAKGHANTVRAIAFSPDGKTMASGSWDTDILVWDVKLSTESNGATVMASVGTASKPN